MSIDNGPVFKDIVTLVFITTEHLLMYFVLWDISFGNYMPVNAMDSKRSFLQISTFFFVTK